MTLATLLVIPDDPAGRNLYAFDHAMAHRQLMAAMGPLYQWAIMPYFIDPFLFDSRPAQNWPLNHQQAHDDFTKMLPAYGAALTEGIPTAQILVDSTLQDAGSRAWFTFGNHQEHLIANNAILPLPLTPTATLPPGTIFALPWWLQAPRLVATYW